MRAGLISHHPTAARQATGPAQSVDRRRIHHPLRPTQQPDAPLIAPSIDFPALLPLSWPLAQLPGVPLTLASSLTLTWVGPSSTSALPSPTDRRLYCSSPYHIPVHSSPRLTRASPNAWTWQFPQKETGEGWSSRPVGALEKPQHREHLIPSPATAVRKFVPGSCRRPCRSWGATVRRGSCASTVSAITNAAEQPP